MSNEPIDCQEDTPEAAQDAAYDTKLGNESETYKRVNKLKKKLHMMPFQTPNGRYYVRWTLPNRYDCEETLPLDTAVEDAFAMEYENAYHRLLGDGWQRNLTKTLRATARMRAREEVHLRVAGDKDAILYDLGGWDRQAIVIRKDGLSLAQPDRDGNDPDARAVARANFYRSEPMMVAEYAPIGVERMLPDAINRLWRYVPVRSQEERALIIGWLVGALLPWLPEYPILAIRGEWNAAKSSTMARLHQLIDPNAWVKRTNLSDGRAIYMASQSSWVVSWDNVRRLSQDASDALAAMSTGAVYNPRELQTTFRETALSALRPILLCGIGDFLVEPDLLSRALLVELPTLDASAMVDTETLRH
ncbi:MAG TPA: hypothetical protein VFN11_03985 [Ktedonobacterales bacterium]|nr:hypothetical protein [Ktedonobacterales bacterium]